MFFVDIFTHVPSNWFCTKIALVMLYLLCHNITRAPLCHKDAGKKKEKGFVSSLL